VGGVGMSVLRFVIPGEPVAKGRARSRVVGRFARHYTPAETRRYETKAATACQEAASEARWQPSPKARFALCVTVYRTHDGKGGDLDNYVKAVSDAINGIAFPDDRYVRTIVAALAQDRERPRVEVEVREVAA
jgi:Holliday junction resolvase RusA-like endonuclease